MLKQLTLQVFRLIHTFSTAVLRKRQGSCSYPLHYMHSKSHAIVSHADVTRCPGCGKFAA